MDHQTREVRVVSLPGCDSRWLGSITDAAFRESSVSVRWVLDGGSGEGADRCQTLALIRYPVDQLLAWFDERCAAGEVGDTPQHWIAHATESASRWHWFVRQWLFDAGAERCLDYNSVYQDPMRLVEAVAALDNAGVPDDAVARCRAALDDRPDPHVFHAFRYYGPGFERVLMGYFVNCPIVDVRRHRLDLGSLGKARSDGTDLGAEHQPASDDDGDHARRDSVSRRSVPDRFDDTPLVILTCTKVGSKSILASVTGTPGLGIDRVYDVHLLAPESRMLAREGLRDAGDRALDSIAAQCALADELFERIIVPGQPARVITAVRDPIEQGISMFFQRIELHHSGSCDDPEKAARELVPEFESWLDPCWMQRWFDVEYPCLVEASVAELAVDADAGGGIGVFGERAVLLLRCGDGPSFQQPWLERFFGRPGVRIPRVHKTADKPLGRVYAAFKSMWRPDEATLEAAFGQPVIRQCYTPEEIDAMMARWTKPVSCAA